MLEEGFNDFRDSVVVIVMELFAVIGFVLSSYILRVIRTRKGE